MCSASVEDWARRNVWQLRSEVTLPAEIQQLPDCRSNSELVPITRHADTVIYRKRGRPGLPELVSDPTVHPHYGSGTGFPIKGACRRNASQVFFLLWKGCSGIFFAETPKIVGIA